MNNNHHDNYRIQGSNSHNRLNEIQDTEQTATEIKDDVILVIADTSFAQISKVKYF